jgi:hypothetical protein
MKMKRETENSNTMQLQFDETHYDMTLQDFAAEFVSDVDWTSPEEVAEEVTNQCWPSIVKIAREGFKKHKRGYVNIDVKRYSAALVYHTAIPKDAEVQYVKPGSTQDKFQIDMPDYDPKKEVVVVLEFLEGYVIGTASIQRKAVRNFRIAA